MKLKQTVSTLFYHSFLLLKKNPLIWLFFYGFVIADLLISRFISGDINRILLLILGLITIGLPGLKVAFLDDAYQGKSPEYKNTPKLLMTYFKKLLLVNLVLIVIGAVFFTAATVTTGTLFSANLNESSVSAIRMVIYLPLAIAYFSLFHLFVITLVKTEKGMRDSFRTTVSFVKKNAKIVSIIVLASLIIHYPISELLMIAVNQLPIPGDIFIIRAVMAFINVLIDLYFFAVWLVLYNKKR